MENNGIGVLEDEEVTFTGGAGVDDTDMLVMPWLGHNGLPTPPGIVPVGLPATRGYLEIKSDFQKLPVAQQQSLGPALMLETFGSPNMAKIIIDAHASSMGIGIGPDDMNCWDAGLIEDPRTVHGEAPPAVFYGIRKRALSLFNGGSGSGKSTAVLDMCYYIAAASIDSEVSELWGIPIESKNEKILYLDPENRGHVRPDRITAIESYTGIPYPTGRLYFHDASGMNLSNPSVMEQLISYVKRKKFTGVVIDPLAFLFHTKEENSNSEAQAQFRELSRLIDETGAWVVAVHHTGKTEGSSSRGAQSREDLAYIVMDLRLAREQEDDEEETEYAPGVHVERTQMVKLKKRKDRNDGAKTVIYLKMDGHNCFVRSDKAAYLKEKTSGSGGMTSEQQSWALIGGIYDSAEYHDCILTAEQIIQLIKKTGGARAPGKNQVREALKGMTEAAIPFLVTKKLPGKGAPIGYYRADVEEDELLRVDNDGVMSPAFSGCAAGVVPDGDPSIAALTLAELEKSGQLVIDTEPGLAVPLTEEQIVRGEYEHGIEYQDYDEPDFKDAEEN